MNGYRTQGVAGGKLVYSFAAARIVSTDGRSAGPRPTWWRRMMPSGPMRTSPLAQLRERPLAGQSAEMAVEDQQQPVPPDVIARVA